MTTLQKYIKRPPKPFNSILKNGEKQNNFGNFNIEKPELLTPMEMELKIQADRVMFAINKALSVLNVMAHLPYLLEDDAAIIRKHFTEVEKNYIFLVLNKFNPLIAIKGSPVAESHLYESVNKIEQNQDEINADDVHLAQVIDLIVNNKCIRQAIKEVENPSLSQYILSFTKAFEQLKDIAHLKLYTTGTEEEERDRNLREAFKSSLMLAAATKDIQEQLAIEREQLGKEINEKVATFEKYQQKIALLKQEFQETIERCVHDSEKKMMQQSIESEAKIAIVAEEAEKITKRYKTLLDDNLNEEKLLRSKRLKAETQLINWIAKYDQDVGEKQEEYEKLQKEYDEEKAAVDKIEDQLDEQQEEYTTLMKEKEEEEERLYMEMAYKLLMSRAARIIQRGWRAYRERKAKRRGKKGKKGKAGKKTIAKK